MLDREGDLGCGPVNRDILLLGNEVIFRAVLDWPSQLRYVLRVAPINATLSEFTLVARKRSQSP